MSGIVVKEGWLVLDMVYGHGEERWTFQDREPGYVDEAFDAGRNEAIPGKVKRIMYFDADDAKVTHEPT